MDQSRNERVSFPNEHIDQVGHVSVRSWDQFVVTMIGQHQVLATQLTPIQFVHINQQVFCQVVSMIEWPKNISTLAQGILGVNKQFNYKSANY